MGAKGKPKDPGSGRKKGTLNRNTQDLMAKCEARGVDPFDVLLEYIVHPSTMELRLSAVKEICQYLYPKRKALEITGVDGTSGIEVIVRDYTSKKNEDWNLSPTKAKAI